MTEKERNVLYHTQLTPETPLCGNCRHFYQHFNEKGQTVECGHCVYPRVKTRMPYDTCEHFQRKEVET